MGSFTFLEGDAFLFHYGWEKYWIKHSATGNDGNPGVGICAFLDVYSLVPFAGATGSIGGPVATF